MADEAEPTADKKPEQKFRNGDKNFPILFEKGGFRAYENSSDEIFLEEIASGTTLRINLYGGRPGSGMVFTQNGHIEATLIRGTVLGWKITPNKGQ